MGSLQKEAEDFDRKKEKDTIYRVCRVTLNMIICIIYYDEM